MQWTARELNERTERDMLHNQTPSHHRYIIKQTVHETGKHCGARGILLSSRLACDVSCKRCRGQRMSLSEERGNERRRAKGYRRPPFRRGKTEEASNYDKFERKKR